MKRFLIIGMILSAIIGCVGCAPRYPMPAFNLRYLPDRTPGSPEKRIPLPDEVMDRAAIRERQETSYSYEYPPLSISWLEEDKLLFNIHDPDYLGRISLTFLINPDTGRTELLEGAQRDALLGRIEKNTEFASLESTADKMVGAILDLFQDRSRVERPFSGKVTNNGTELNFGITLQYRRRTAGPGYYECRYTVKNVRTGSAYKGARHIEDEDVGDFKLNEDSAGYVMKEWLRSWRISPDGRYYIIAKTASFIDPESMRPAVPLVRNYPFAGFDISPRWDRIALLVFQEDEKTKQRNYWIEFYPFREPKR